MELYIELREGGCGHVRVTHLLRLYFTIIKVDNPYPITFLTKTPSMFEWYVVWCGSKNEYQKDMCLKILSCMLKH